MNVTQQMEDVNRCAVILLEALSAAVMWGSGWMEMA